MAERPEAVWLSGVDGQPRPHFQQAWGQKVEPPEVDPSAGDPSSPDPGAPGVTVPDATPPSLAAAGPPPPQGWSDPLTGADGPRLWARFLATEQARNARHRRTSAIVLVQVVGFEAAATRWGWSLAVQLFVQLADGLVRHIRKSDHIARIGPTTFAVLLTETDEISAINFVDRMQASCARDIDVASTGLQLKTGWASPERGGRLEDAYAVAEARLAEALEQSG